ncbi:unnamed protein product [Lepeophtheirus salmonis]|uniref:(salmon louse) hypothetical protein n=1 Tax=Lepeophtheirus salmonis TaxID=72036 RepID=A0A7R8CVK8_LEPSM|nr:unnamed protein product [Lepeophtheirus salmonis]CAF2945897.1 unnamed protein product [Lepeophtheirus salmonis]
MALNFEKMKKNCFGALSFEEVDIKNRFEIETKTQPIYGDCKKVQPAMVLGLFKSWKQPVYFKFQAPMTKKRLMEIINEFEVCGIQIFVVIFDLGNKTFLSKLGIQPISLLFCTF